MSPLCESNASCFPRGDRLTGKLSGKGQLSCGEWRPHEHKGLIQVFHVQYLNGWTATFSENNNEVSHLPRIWLYFLARGIPGYERKQVHRFRQ